MRMSADLRPLRGAEEPCGLNWGSRFRDAGRFACQELSIETSNGRFASIPTPNPVKSEG
jgi:hypothetical protein